MVETMLAIFDLESRESRTEEEEGGMSKPRGTPDTNSKKTEFEVRVGKMNAFQSKFNPGITPKHFAQYKAQLDADTEMACDISETTLCYYDLPKENGNVRIEIDPISQAPIRSQMKKR